MAHHKKSRNKIYLSIIGIFTAFMFTIGIVGTYISYPTAAHREVSSSMQESVEKNGGTYNFAAYDTPEYNELYNSSEAQYTSGSQLFVMIGQMILTVIVIGKVYKYIRRNNISNSKRAVGVTALLAAAGNMLSYVALMYPLAFLTATPVVINVWFPIGLLGIGILTLIVSFIIASLFEIVYNKRNSFVVE